MINPRQHHQYFASSGIKGKPKSTTRHLAALDFLLNIQLKNEAQIRGIVQKEEYLVDTLEALHDQPISANDASGKKLQGPYTPTVRIPPQIRYQLKNNEQSAIIRNWEDQLSKVLLSSAPNLNPQHYTHQQNPQSDMQSHSHRLFVSRSRGYPSMIFSVIKYDAGEEKARLLRAEDLGLDVFDMPQRDWRGTGFRKLFVEEEEDGGQNNFFEYDPDGLDDPKMLYGTQRHVKRSNYAPIITSVINYVNKQDLKNELNDQFRELHPTLPPSLTLSKIRNLKKVALVACCTDRMPVPLEVSTVALAFISYERLCLKGLVTKANRRLTMAVCLLLAFKFHENYLALYKERLDALFAFFDREWDLPKRQVLEAEFMAFVHLGFNLHVPNQYINIVYGRLLKSLNKTSKGYLGEEMFETFEKDVRFLSQSQNVFFLDSN